MDAIRSNELRKIEIYIYVEVAKSKPLNEKIMAEI
jgi:hypothetical protein